MISVEHHREGMDVPVTESEIELTLAMRDEHHCSVLLESLRSLGYQVERLQIAMQREQRRKVVTVLLRRPRRLHSAPSRSTPRTSRRSSRPYHDAPSRRARAPRRHGREVHRRRGDGALRGAGRARGRSRAGRSARRSRSATGRARRASCRSGSRITTGEALVVARRAARARARGWPPATSSTRPRACRAAAPVNGILVDETTYRATRDGDRLPRGRRRSRRRASRSRSRSGRRVEARSRFGVDVAHGDGTPLVGRGARARLLVDALARAREERSPQLVTLVGVPGIGKSRLVYELLADGRRGRRSSSLAAGPLAPLRRGSDLLGAGRDRQGAGGHPRERHARGQAEEKLARSGGPSWLDASERQWLERHLRPLAGVGAEDEPGPGPRRAFAAWRRFFEALAEERPLVLVFEDLHWADDGLAGVRRPPGRAGRAAVPLLVVVHRPARSCSSAGRAGAAASATRHLDLALAALGRGHGPSRRAR